MTLAQSKLMVYAVAALIIGLIIGGAVGYFAGAGAVKTVTATTTVTAPGAATTVTATVTSTVTKAITKTVTAPGAPAVKFRVALFISNLGNPYFVMLKEGAEAAVKELKGKGLDVELKVYDAKDDPALQSSQIETAVGEKVNAIVVNPVHKEAIQPALKKAVDAGIPVVTTDRDVADKSLRIAFTGTDNVMGAELAAKALLKALEASGKSKPWKVVILNGIPGTTAAEERKKGFHNILDPLVKKGEVKIIAEEVANFRRDQGLSVMESILAKTKEVDAVICANDEMALGAIQAIKGAGLKPGKDIIVVGYDAIPDAVEAVKKGEMFATIAQSPFLQGYWGIMIAYYHIFFGWQPPSFIPTPVVVVTKENVETFSEEVAKPKPLPLGATVTVTVTKTVTATAIPTPTGEIILTVKGKILKTNKDGVFVFDLEMLKSLGTLTYKEYDPWFKKELEYTGVPLVKVLEYVGVAKDATKVAVVAKDKYKVVFNLKALMESEVGKKILLAFMVNGKPLRPVFKFEIDAGGPIRLAYPYLKGQEDVKKEVEEKLLIGVWDGKGKALGKKFAPAHEWMVCEIIVE